LNVRSLKRVSQWRLLLRSATLAILSRWTRRRFVGKSRLSNNLLNAAPGDAEKPRDVVTALPLKKQPANLHALVRFESISARIVRLLARRRPTAIFRFIVAVAVDALNRAAIWAWTHVGKKVLERVQPALAHRDASAAVSVIPGILGVVAAGLHVRPGLVFSRHFPAFGVAVLDSATPASARDSRAALNQVARDGLSVPAVALTYPENVCAPPAYRLNSNQETGSNTSNIKRICHVVNIAVLLSLSACSRAAQKPIEPPRVEIVPPPTCDLPPLPDPIEPKVVGFPTPETVMVSREDMVSIISYVTGLHDWVHAAAGCIEQQQTFGEAVNGFLRGK